MKGDIFHIINRGVEKRKIFLTDEDYLRFIHNLKDFNCSDLVTASYHDRRKYEQSLLERRLNTKLDNELVDILCWCLMPNHYHILVQEKIDKGVSMFSKKISSGYTQSFNLKYKRSGVLFQGRSKIIQIENDEHLLFIPYYIFSNPIKLIKKNWKDYGLDNAEKAVEFLESYKWSNYSIVTNNKDYPFVGDRDLFFEIFDTNKEQFRKDFITWLCDSQK
ncbi:MAG: transposase [Parcubacteria group bacterium]|nr:transposase [Parcubacteria group bacterium]MCR4342609.1 transposase [Patescibacteria group bacterium]